jgi:hypothetical protein
MRYACELRDKANELLHEADSLLHARLRLHFPAFQPTTAKTFPRTVQLTATHTATLTPILRSLEGETPCLQTVPATTPTANSPPLLSGNPTTPRISSGRQMCWRWRLSFQRTARLKTGRISPADLFPKKPILCGRPESEIHRFGVI